jgi:hypothetical protein
VRRQRAGGIRTAQVTSPELLARRLDPRARLRGPRALRCLGRGEGGGAQETTVARCSAKAGGAGEPAETVKTS